MSTLCASTLSVAQAQTAQPTPTPSNVNPPATSAPVTLVPMTQAPPTSPEPNIPIPPLPPAPPAPSGPAMTIDQYIAQVLAINPAVQQAQLAIQRAEQQIDQVKGQGLPQVRIGASDTYSSVPTLGSSAQSIPTVTPINSVPTITDAASGTISTQPLSSASTEASAGSGSSSTTTSINTPTITPVAPPSVISPSSPPSTTGVLSPSNTVPNDATSDTVSRSVPDASGSGSISVPLQDNNYGASGSVSQIIDIFGLVKTNTEIANANKEFYQLDLERNENDQALNAKEVYYAVVKAQSDVATDQEQLKNAQAILANAQVNVNAGASPQFDLISAEAGVSSAQAALINAENELQVERANFNTLLIRPLDAGISVVSDTPPTLPYDAAAQDYINLAYAQRPEVLQTALTEAIAGKLTRIAHEGLLPSIGLTGGVTYTPVISFSTTSHTTETLTASLNVPLYDGGQTAAEVNIGRINEAQQRSIAEATKLNVALEVQTALVNVLDAQALVASNSAAVAQDREALDQANLLYKAQVGTLLEVTNAEANLAIAEDNLNSSVYQQQTAYASLLRAEGKR